MAIKFLILAAIAVSCVAAYPGHHDVDYYVRIFSCDSLELW